MKKQQNSFKVLENHFKNQNQKRKIKSKLPEALKVQGKELEP